MKEEIKKELSRLEQQNNIKILFAVESGSRAWGFESTNSDWDVRFVYIHPQEWYLSIDDKKDSIDEILPSDIDLGGWELQKALRLFRKSNPPLLEWLRSPIIYSENYSAAGNLRGLAKEYFSPRSSMYHYLSIAKGNFREYLQTDEVRLKKYFYVLRPVFACMWIENMDSMPPMEFQKLMEAQELSKDFRKEIDILLHRKRNAEELSTGRRIDIINQFLDEKIKYYENYVSQFVKIHQADTEKLNLLFRNTLKEVYGT